MASARRRRPNGCCLSLGSRRSYWVSVPMMRQSALLAVQFVDFPRGGHFAPTGEHLLLEDVGGPDVEAPHPDHPEQGLLLHDVDAGARNADVLESGPGFGEVLEDQHVGVAVDRGMLSVQTHWLTGVGASIRASTSARVAALVRKMPLTAEVTTREPGARSPRMDMHRCSALTRTSTPAGSSACTMLSAMVLVSRSCS